MSDNEKRSLIAKLLAGCAVILILVGAITYAIERLTLPQPLRTAEYIQHNNITRESVVSARIVAEAQAYESEAQATSLLSFVSAVQALACLIVFVFVFLFIAWTFVGSAKDFV